MPAISMASVPVTWPSVQSGIDNTPEPVAYIDNNHQASLQKGHAQHHDYANLQPTEQ